MEDFAMLNSNLADPTLIGTLRGPGVENQPVTDTPVNSTIETFGNNGTDIVDFSDESLQLSRLANNEQAAQAAAGIPETDNGTDENPNTASDLITTPFEGSNNSEPFNLGELNTGTDVFDNPPGTTPAEATTTQATGPGGSVNVGPPGIETGVTQNAQGELESRAFATESDLRTTLVENSTAASVKPENPEVGLIDNPEIEPENNFQNVQQRADQLRELNSSLNFANGQPSESPVTDVDRAQQPAQFDEQVLLQNVSSQLAQTVPPATVVSVLG